MITTEFGGGIVLSSEDIEKTVDGVISVIKKELPEEALCVATIDSLLEEVRIKIQLKQIIL